AAAGAVGTNDLVLTAASVESAIHPQAVGWWVLAALAGLAGLAVVAQALSRQSSVEAEQYHTLAAVGMSADDLVALGLARALAVGIAGALGAVLLAYLLSPIAPVGEARVAEPSTGLAFDPLVLGLGAFAIVVAVVVLAAWPIYRTSRLMRRDSGGSGRPSSVVAHLAAAGAPASMVIGVRRALDRGRGRESVPVGSALGGAMLAVAALCGTAVFGASLTHLVATPPLYGQDFGLWLNGFQTSDQATAAEAQLQADKAVRAVTLGLQTPVVIDGVAAHSIAGKSLKGPILVSPASGRLPRQAGEVALGSGTLRQIHARIGALVRMTFPLQSGGSRTIEARVTGTASFPPDFGVVGLGTGAYMTYDGLVAAQCSTGPASAACAASATQNPVLLTAMVRGAAGGAAIARYDKHYAGLSYVAEKPDNLVNFGQAVNFPLILGAVLMVFGLATLLHVLVVSVARRRRELGLLKAVGLVRHQIIAAVCWQATTVAVAGLVVGLPLGIVAGRAVWHAFAVNLGVVPQSIVDVSTLVALSAGVLVIANLLAVGPALVSVRTPANSLLKTE
ncbi:MAG TPA: ABC transporter permease, partial [Acidimicrobiales bacterium]|nr:ABC transporter permease [Acidimicrobiales bacterium]